MVSKIHTNMRSTPSMPGVKKKLAQHFGLWTFPQASQCPFERLDSALDRSRKLVGYSRGTRTLLVTTSSYSCMHVGTR